MESEHETLDRVRGIMRAKAAELARAIEPTLENAASQLKPVIDQILGEVLTGARAEGFRQSVYTEVALALAGGYGIGLVPHPYYLLDKNGFPIREGRENLEPR